MLTGYAFVLAFILVGIAFVFANILIGRLVQPRSFSRGKALTYECGEIPVGPGWMRFNTRFYVIALAFIIFDVELAVTFPVALVFRGWVLEGRGGLVLAELLIFLAILVTGLIYLLKNGDLDWIKTLGGDREQKKPLTAFDQKYFEPMGYDGTRNR